MKGLYIFAARLVIAAAAAVIISLVFFRTVEPVKTGLLAAGLLFLAIIFEKTRNS